MSAVAPALPSQDLLAARIAVEYLLLGDLLELLEEPPSPLNERWLLAVLDVLLAGRTREVPPPYILPALSSPGAVSAPGRLWMHRTTLFAKLGRLRDRLAHRSAYQLLANEIRCDLRSAFAVTNEPPRHPLMNPGRE